VKPTAPLAAIAAIGLFAGAAAAEGASAPAEVRGTVLDANASPVVGADVVLAHPDGSGRRVAITDDSGRFSLLAADAGSFDLLVVTARGARHLRRRVELAPGRALSFTLRDDPTAVAITEAERAAPALTEVDLTHQIALARNRDLAGVLERLPGTAPAAAPMAAPVVFGRAAGELPVWFEGFLLNDPVDGSAPLHLAADVFDAVSVTAGPEPGLVLTAPTGGGPRIEALGGLGAARAARGADGVSRPTGTTGGWLAGGRVDWFRDGRLIAAGVIRQDPWTADPTSITGPRGERNAAKTSLVWGRLDLAGWRLGAGGLADFIERRRGRAEQVLPVAEPGDQDRLLGQVGVSATRQLFAGANELGFRVGYLAARDRTRLAGVDDATENSHRISLAGRLSLGGRWAGSHLFTLATGVDFEGAERTGIAGGRQPGLVAAGAEADARLFWAEARERWSPVPSFDLALGLRVGGTRLGGKTNFAAAPALERSFSTDLFLGPSARLDWRPLARDLAFFAAVGRYALRLPLGPALGAAAGPRSDLAAPAEDALAVGAELAFTDARLGVTAHARRTVAIVEDRFSPTSGRLELFAPPGAERRYQALVADGEVGLPLAGGRTRLGMAAILARQEGNHVGFVDEASGALRPAGTSAFDGPDVEVNRAGALPFDRPYGLRGFIDAELPLPGGLRLRTTVRGRIDAGTPRAATARSIASGSGTEFLVERGSLGRTAAVTSLDAGLKLTRRFGATEAFLIMEGFNLTGQRPPVARDPVFTEEIVQPQPGARGTAGLAAVRNVQGSPVDPMPSFARAIAYAEPLLVRGLLGLAFD
jgi:Carboxypeptidase regulatory-like domain